MNVQERNELRQRRRLIKRIKLIGVETWMHQNVSALTDNKIDFKNASRAEQLVMIKEFNEYIDSIDSVK
ncbi:MAG: hypothetical protein ACRC3J_09115 [Culicoidibacterales bacterium]